MRHVLLFLFLLVFGVPQAQAELKLFPLWTEKTCDGQTWGCYSFAQMKDIVKLDLNLQLRLEKCGVWQTQYSTLDDAYLKLRKAYDLSQDVRIRLETRLDEKTKLIQEMAEQVHKYADSNIWGGALPWVVVGLVVSFAGGVVCGVYLSK